MPKQIRDRDPKLQRIFVHGLRVAIFVAILWMIRDTHSRSIRFNSDLNTDSRALAVARGAIAGAENVLPASDERGVHSIVDESGDSVGYMMQSSPQSDHIVGYSGPTNCLIVFDTEDKIRALAILNSGDTVDHVDAVRRDEAFFESFTGIEYGDLETWQQIDAVSGATLTSYSIIATVANRMGADAPSLKFRDRPAIENVRVLFPDVSRIESTTRQNVWEVYFHAEKVGQVVSTTPYADQLSGYQGPTVTLAGFDLSGKCIGLIVDQTYENEPYALYLNDDRYFQKFYVGKTLDQIATMNPEEEGIDGVSGATMTSVTVADGLFITAQKTLEDNRSPFNPGSSRRLISYWSDVVTLLLTMIGIAFSFNVFRKSKSIRLVYQLAVIAFLGFINGHMLSQASIVGWSQNAVPWTVVPGLVFLSIAAIVVPIVSKHQPYCHHICPFGALQQMTKNRIKWRLKIPKNVDRILSWIPLILLLFVVFVAVSSAKFNLASIEPFDGFAFRVAGWATIGIFMIGLAISFVSPMAYCRYGCPTGAMLGFLKFRSDSHRMGMRDYAAVTLLALAFMIG